MAECPDQTPSMEEKENVVDDNTGVGQASNKSVHKERQSVIKRNTEIERTFEPPQTSPKTPKETNTVYFYLLIQDDQLVDKAEIHVTGNDERLPLFRVPEKEYLWYIGVTFTQDPIKSSVNKYHYSCAISGSHDHVVEIRQRTTAYQAQFDVFYFPDERYHEGETIPMSVISYIKWFFDCVEDSTLSDILTNIQSFHSKVFGIRLLKTSEHFKELIGWILKQITENSTTDLQQLYLCMIFCHLTGLHKNLDLAQYLNDKTEIVDHMLQGVKTCSRSSYLSKSDHMLLEKIAVILVKKSSSPNWLNLAVNFYSYLGVQFLLKHKEAFPANTNDCKKYLNNAKALFSCLKIENQNDQDAHQELLRRVIKNAPNLASVTQLFNCSEVSKLFANDDKKVNLFLKYYTNAQNSGTAKKCLLGELVKFYQMPEQIRGKLQKSLYPKLRNYAESEEEKDENSEIEVDGNDEHVFVKLIVSMKHPDVEKLSEILRKLSKSKSCLRQQLLLKILNNETFMNSFGKIPHEKRLKICKSLVTTNVSDQIRDRASNSSPVATVYQSIDEVLNSLNVFKESEFAQEVCGLVVDHFLKNEKVISVLEASAAIENCSPAVQECYVGHVRKLLTPELIETSSEIVLQCSRNSLDGKLLSCVLEFVDVPDGDSEIDKDDLAKILLWSDIWTILLKTNDLLEDCRRFQLGKGVFQRLTTHIEQGSISVDFVELLVEKQEIVLKLCALAQREKSSQTLEGQFSKLTDVIRDCRKRITLIKLAIDYAKKLSKEVYPVQGIECITEEFEKLTEIWRTREVNDLQDDALWGKFIDVISCAEKLEPLENSLFFETMAKKSLEELKVQNMDGSSNGSEAAEAGDFHQLIKFLTTKVIDEFREKWDYVYKTPGSVSVETMKALLGTLNESGKLHKELLLLQEYFKKQFSDETRSYIENVMNYPIILRQIPNIIAILAIFGFKEDQANETMSLLLKFQTVEFTLESLHQFLNRFKEKVPPFPKEKLDAVVKELKKSKKLLLFLNEIVHEDIRFLIDAAEEHFDQSVPVSSVSDLISIHGLLSPLIKAQNKRGDPHNFLKELEKSRIGNKDTAGKIRQCRKNVNSLRGLYMSIVNRGETSKEIISNCLRIGEYCVSQKDGATMSYQLLESGEKRRKCTYSLSDLRDLRSRALVIDSSESKVLFSHSSKRVEEIDFTKFINQVDLLTEISTLLSKLYMSGYSRYRQFCECMKGTDDLRSTRDALQRDLVKWKDILKEKREQFYFLNYYRSDQLCTLSNFLTIKSDFNCHDREVLSLLRFANQTITKQELQESQKKLKRLDPDSSPELLLLTVGQALENILDYSKSPIREINSDDRECKLHSKLEATVKPGEIFIATLNPGSPLMINVMLTLYENTSKAFPEPYQVVFCSSQTTWEEIHLLLQRCFNKPKYSYHKSLFCLTNVELLPCKLQFRLVDAIRENKKSYKCSADGNEIPDYLLALICLGGDYHHIVEQFAQYTHHIVGMSDNDLEHCLTSSCPDVKIITSTLPGLGKTEHIKREVRNKRMNVITFPISGPFELTKLLQRLKELKLKKYHCLHLDIGEVNDPLSLDTFLFQLIVTGMVSAGNQFYHLPTTHIYIEIANTLEDTLRESLLILKYFTRTHLEWNDFRNLEVSSEITSNVQVVCQYLHFRPVIEKREVQFSGPETPDPLPTERCQELLREYFKHDDGITFAVLNTFLGVLADQLLKFSHSAFFKIRHIQYMAGDKATIVRKNLLNVLLEVSKQFACRSIRTFHSGEIRNLSAISNSSRNVLAASMVDRVRGMIQWEDSNHLLVVFHDLNSQSITAICREESLVPSNVKKILRSQDPSGGLNDFKAFTQEQLHEKLAKIVCIKKAEENDLFPTYVLTRDNILKMILIILRVRANVPVIIMGETGCGKTSLIRYLAKTCKVTFKTFPFHAGTSREQIITFITREDREQINAEKWIFLDEINTCDHLGLISEIVCHHSLLGRPLSTNLVFLAACNPYKLRPEEHIKTAGLEGKNITDEYSKLVYRVHPLPEAMTDYVWDYGSLNPEDERNYIERMVRVSSNLDYESHKGVLIDCLVQSQEFVRKAENNNFCVSLRDVDRCIFLIKWFQEMIKKRKDLKGECPKHLQEYHKMTISHDENVKSIVLALAHCYMTRLPSSVLREKYREKMILLFTKNGFPMTYKEDLDSFGAIVRIEEEDYLERMKPPSGTARNSALRENVFVMLVCILNRIPIFVVGKPGCSKSLSIQLIRSNLRGLDSRDPLFRQLPQLYVVSYQGSESSTSEGIIKVFEKAEKYTTHNQNENVLPVVLLDEVGLAENSKYNPLKVLHSLLEPSEGKFPNVAVVGISNWSLDAAKMNRAIHLSRPDPTKRDLLDIKDSLHRDDLEKSGLNEEVLVAMVDAYFEYQGKQLHANFHGLRDYYSLIKSPAKNITEVNLSLKRHFGGLPACNIQKLFIDKLTQLKISSTGDIISVTQLIQANLKDPHARHLMLITSEDSAIGILNPGLMTLEKKIIKIFGSFFQEDLSEEYNYRILSYIIHCMEQNCIIILKDLERIYGSLYDMLNQNYAVVGNRKYCRVALGAYSIPMCQVNDGFRCIVLVDEQKVDFSDPPFLNRFEKQLLRFTDVLTEEQNNIITELHDWVEEISTVEGLQSLFNESDMFIGFHEDTLPSLVLSHSNQENSLSNNVLKKKCKDDLMWIASIDGVLRMRKCSVKHSNEVRELSEAYFKKPLHQGFAFFMKNVTSQQESSFFVNDEIGSKIVVMTFASIHTDISQCLDNPSRCQVERLSAYKSEKELTKKINGFWNTSEKDLLVLQCKPDLDSVHWLLASTIIEENRNAYKQKFQQKTVEGMKHVCIVVHVRRKETTNVPWQFSLLCGWKQVFLDVLKAPVLPLNEILCKSIQELPVTSIWPYGGFTQNDLVWCFTCIKYTQIQRPLNSVLHIVKNLFKSTAVSNIVKKLILESIIVSHNIKQDDDTHLNWQFKVACNRQLLLNSSTFRHATEQYISGLVRNRLARIIYFLEKANAWPPHLVMEINEHPSHEILISRLEDVWCDFFVDNELFKISDIPEPLGAESYVLESATLDLCIPFIQTTCKKIDGVKKLFLEMYKPLTENGVKSFSKMVAEVAPELCSDTLDYHELYMKDVFDIMTANYSQRLSRSQRVSIVQAVFVSEAMQNLPANNIVEFCTLVHTFVWEHRENILDLLAMIHYCRPFINPDDIALPDVLQIPKEVMYVNVYKRKSINEDTEQCEKLERYGEILVTAYCEKMLPSEKIVDSNGGLPQWIQNTNLLLSLASNISEYPTALHYLRLCVDFSRIIFELPSLSSLLYTLNDIGAEIRPDYLDHKKSFEKITDQVIKPTESQIADDKDFQKFLSIFFCRCIDTNVDTGSARQIVEHVLRSRTPEIVRMMSPVMLRLLAAEEDEKPGIFIDLINNESVIKNQACLKNIDGVLKDYALKGVLHYDSYPAVMICGLIQSQLTLKDFKMDRSDNRHLELANSAVQVLSQKTENCGLKVLSAVAFLREFFTKLAPIIAKLFPSKIYTTHGFLMTEVNLLLESAPTSLQLFFFKKLNAEASIFDLRKWFGALTTLKNLWLNETNIGKAVFTSGLKIPQYEEAKAAYLKLISGDELSMNTFLKDCRHSPKHAFALLGILINMVYLKRAVRKLNDKEEQLVKWFAQNAVSLERGLFQELLLRIIGRQDFHCPELQLSPESSVDDVEFALLVLHIACVIATGAQNENLPFYRYVTNPVKFKQPLVLAHCEEELHSIFKYKPYLMDSVLATCQCGVRLAFHSEINEPKCPSCHEALDDKEEIGRSATTPFSCHNESIPQSDLCAKHMPPAVYRALHLIVYSSYYAGIALGTSTEEKVSTVLNILRGINVSSDSRNAANICLEDVNTDLSYLMRILSCKKDKAIETLHLVVEKSSDLIREENDCSTSKSRRDWETTFSRQAESAFLESRRNSKKTKEFMQPKQTDDSQAKVTLECLILELDNYPEQAEEQNKQLKRLFRVTKQPSLEDFRSAFLHSPEEVQSKHNFLTLFFAKSEQILIIRHLYHLLKWSRLISSALTHRISRRDAEKKRISEFMTDRPLELRGSETNNLQEMFNNFKNAWNKMCPIVNKELIDEKEKMKRLTENSKVAYCLTESDSGIYLKKAIEILVCTQNSILDAIISLSLHHQPALSFLQKDKCSGIASSSVQNVKRKEIISFQWTGDLFRHAYNNLDYGKGQEVTYDFEEIEMELAREIAVGKCYLTGKLNEFMFSKELFHSCRRLLTEFRSLMEQDESLPDDVRGNLLKLKEDRIKDAQCLLKHIEVLIFLLKRKLQDVPKDMTLEELTGDWSTLLPSLFPINLLPKPQSSIKVKHVAALYEALEDVLADGVIEGLDDKFREELPDEMKETIGAMLDSETDELKTQNVLQAVRRFVFRYLSSETESSWPEKSTSLQHCLEEPSLWFPLPGPPNLDEILRELTLKNIHSFLIILQEKLKPQEETHITGKTFSDEKKEEQNPKRRRQPPKMKNRKK